MPYFQNPNQIFTLRPTKPNNEEYEDTIFNSKFKKLKQLSDQYAKEKNEFINSLTKYTTRSVGKNTMLLKDDGYGQIGLFIAGESNTGIRIKIKDLSKFIETLKEFETFSKMSEEEFNSYILQRQVLDKI